MTRDTSPAFSDVKGADGQAYNEPAFRYFLNIERNRAQRRARSVALVLVNSRTKHQTPTEGLEPDAMDAIFDALTSSVRDADFVGWYQEGRVAAAVLAMGDNAPSGVRKQLADRVGLRLKERMASKAAGMRVRVFELGQRTRP
jgi:hypothetical protein